MTVFYVLRQNCIHNLSYSPYSNLTSVPIAPLKLLLSKLPKVFMLPKSMDPFLSLSYPTYKWFISQLATAAFLNTFLLEILWYMLAFVFSIPNHFSSFSFIGFSSTQLVNVGIPQDSVLVPLIVPLTTPLQRSQPSNRIEITFRHITFKSRTLP